MGRSLVSQATGIVGRVTKLSFTLLCEGQKGHNTGQKGHNTGHKAHFRDKRGQNKVIQDKRAEGVPFWLCFFLCLRMSTVTTGRLIKF